MLSANTANESAWIVSLTSVSFPVFCDHNKGQGHLRSPGEKSQTLKFRNLELRYMFLGQIFAKNAKNDPKTLFEASKSVKKQNSENHG